MSELLKLDLFSNNNKENFNQENFNQENFNQEDQTTTTYILEEGTSEEQLGEQSEDKIEVSRHAYERLHERCGLSRKAATRMAEKAFYTGMKHSDTRGQINRWITSLYFNNKNANNIRLYGNFAYIFCNKILVTVLEIPNNLKNRWKPKDLSIKSLPKREHKS